MSKKELNKAMIIGLVLDKRISQIEAAERLQISTRQIKRLVKRVRLQGPESLIHGSRGKKKPLKYCSKIQVKILDLIKSKYRDFGPTLAAEKLEEIDNINVSVEWLRQFMMKKGLWRAKQKKIQIHSPRARRKCYGELVQIDGSHHAWFEDRGPKCVALVFVDDATSRLQTVHFCKTEDLKNYLIATKSYLEAYGCPKEIYTDKHSVFTVNHMRGGENKGKTHYAKVLSAFNIKQHLANSPQAKGRVERMNRVLQDRLVKEFRMAEISDIDAANAYMSKFIDKYNIKFAKPAKAAHNHHILLTEEQKNNMNYILAVKEYRKVSKALTVQYQNKIYVINNIRAVRTLRKKGVIVYAMLDGSIKIYCDDKELSIDFLEYADNYIASISRKELDIELDSQNEEFESIKNIPGSPVNQRGHFNLGEQGDIF